MSEASSSSQPRGPLPPQLAAALLAAMPPREQPLQADGSQPPQAQQPTSDGEHAANGPENAEGSSPISQSAGTAAGGRRGRNPAIGTDEWTRQRKDNHVRAYLLSAQIPNLIQYRYTERG
jgi:transcriptional regulator CBF1